MNEELSTKSMHSLADEELVLLAHGGSREAEDILCERYKNTVRIKTRPYFLMGADREDLVQEGMIGLYKAIRDYMPGHKASFRSFAEMCILRQAITAIKGAARQKHGPLNSYISLYTAAGDEDRALIDVFGSLHAESPEETILGREAVNDIFSSIRELLTPLEKQVLALFLEGKNYAEIACRLGCGTKTVDNALQRVKRKLDRRLHQSAN